MNSIQKEREAFEKKFPVPAHWIDFDGLKCKYICKCNAIDDVTLKYQARWEAWQAAKAQAVPEGFVLVPMVPSERMVNAVRQCYEGESYLPYSLYSEFVNQAIIERMETQEPAND